MLKVERNLMERQILAIIFRNDYSHDHHIGTAPLTERGGDLSKLSSWELEELLDSEISIANDNSIE